MCDLITDNEKRLKMDKDKYGVSDTVINRIKTEIIKLNAEIKTGWNKKSGRSIYAAVQERIYCRNKQLNVL